MKYFTSIILAATVLISGCQSVLVAGAEPETKKWQIPAIGETKTIGVGDTIYQYQYTSVDELLRGRGWKKELVYLGNDGDKINVIYRDYNGNLRRPSSELETQHEYAVGESISLNGAEFTVLALEGNSLTYEVNTGFRGEIE